MEEWIEKKLLKVVLEDIIPKEMDVKGCISLSLMLELFMWSVVHVCLTEVVKTQRFVSNGKVPALCPLRLNLAASDIFKDMSYLQHHTRKEDQLCMSANPVDMASANSPVYWKPAIVPMNPYSANSINWDRN